MGFTELLTIIFILLKVFEVIDWSWWIVFLPEIIAVVLYIAFIAIGFYGQYKATKHFRDAFDEDFKF